MSYLELENLSRHFVRREGWPIPRKTLLRAVDGFSLSIEKGEILGLVGESGCGKSTLSKLVMQLLAPTSGSVVLEGERLADLPAAEIRKRRRDFQMIFQDPYASLNPRMTVYSTLAEAILTRRTELKATVPRSSPRWPRDGAGRPRPALHPEVSARVFRRAAPTHRDRPGPRTGAEADPRRRAGSALDVSIQSQILNLLLKLRDELDLTMIFISHDLSVVRYLADRIAVMEKGRIVEVAGAEALFANPQSSASRNLLKAIPKIRYGAGASLHS